MATIGSYFQPDRTYAKIAISDLDDKLLLVAVVGVLNAQATIPPHFRGGGDALLADLGGCLVGVDKRS